jgi:hypothetical protein
MKEFNDFKKPIYVILREIYFQRLNNLIESLAAARLNGIYARNELKEVNKSNLSK